MNRRRLAPIALIAAIGAAACGADAPPEAGGAPSDADARTVLRSYVAAAASARDAATYCAQSFLGEGCEHDFARAGGVATMPTSRPSVTGSRVADGRVRVLVVCGTRRDGDPYRTDFAVERDDHGGLRAVIPVFWSGTSFSGVVDPSAPQSASSAEGRPATC